MDKVDKLITVFWILGMVGGYGLGTVVTGDYVQGFFGMILGSQMAWIPLIYYCIKV